MPYYTFEDLLTARYQIPPKKPKPVPFFPGKEPAQEIMQAFNPVFSGNDLEFIGDTSGIYISADGSGHSYTVTDWSDYDDILEFLGDQEYYFNQANLINQDDEPTYFDTGRFFIFVTEADPAWPKAISEYNINGTDTEYDVGLIVSSYIKDTTQFPTINGSLSFSLTDAGLLTITATNDFYSPNSVSKSIDFSQIIQYGQTLGFGTKEDFTLYTGFSVINTGPPPTITYEPATYVTAYIGSQNYNSTMHTGSPTAVILRGFLQYPDYVIKRS